MSTSPAREGSANAASNDTAEEKPRLSEHEKKANHIASEQKRRQAIREGFDRLTELVPGLEGQGRSESVVLKKTVDYMRAQLDERRRLVARIEELGGHVDDGMRR
ncbi:HLH, helix-loop-helix DNA-binding protein [Venustampulla echinocandica]|uniref:HLH, helix-loop-helix DNA-binding protein n=1 Tax=Venustampulla echinocandica TaxID=2656787 RepID=A0A370U3Y9_9HELO|nr:HLH, helix-loop-helix DNA-binding protein [Venustampulla echinocandica]RDL42482.1 HLH, helix-loop-helix DNA-binding protein [Venustampulla echinocandica]